MPRLDTALETEDMLNLIFLALNICVMRIGLTEKNIKKIGV
jgi:hypothetical protein